MQSHLIVLVDVSRTHSNPVFCDGDDDKVRDTYHNKHVNATHLLLVKEVIFAQSRIGLPV